VVFEGRLQQAIPSDRRATIGSLKGFAGRSASPASIWASAAGQATSYQIAFGVCGLAGVAIRPGYLASARGARAGAWRN